MHVATVVAALMIAAGVGGPRTARAQGPATDLVRAARAQLRAGNVDSGLSLVRVALDSATRATQAERVNALVWRGILEFFKGSDSLARQSFHAALTIDPRLDVAGLAGIDSDLAVEFEAVRHTIAAPATAAAPSAALARLAGRAPRPTGDTVYSCVPQCRGLDQAPHVLATSPTTELVLDPAVLAARPPARSGLALFRFTIDTAGLVEPGSVHVVTAPNAEFNDALMDQIRAARFAPGRVGGRAVRVVLQWRYSFPGR